MWPFTPTSFSLGMILRSFYHVARTGACLLYWYTAKHHITFQSSECTTLCSLLCVCTDACLPNYLISEHIMSINSSADEWFGLFLLLSYYNSHLSVSDWTCSFGVKIPGSCDSAEHKLACSVHSCNLSLLSTLITLLVYMCVCVYMYMCRCPWRPEEGILKSWIHVVYTAWLGF